MKKVLILLILTMILSACGANTADTKPQPKTNDDTVLFTNEDGTDCDVDDMIEGDEDCYGDESKKKKKSKSKALKSKTSKTKTASKVSKPKVTKPKTVSKPKKSIFTSKPKSSSSSFKSSSSSKKRK